MPDAVTNKQLYELVDDRTKTIMAKFDNHETRIVKIENWQSRVIWQLGLVASIGGALIKSGWDWGRRQVGI